MRSQVLLWGAVLSSALLAVSLSGQVVSASRDIAPVSYRINPR